MALADIIARIAADATREADAVVLEAREAADEARGEAQALADAQRERSVARARTGALAEARTRVAAARLAARDRELAAKREAIDRVLAEVTAQLHALPDAEYAALIAREVARVARGGERLAYGEADAPRLASHLPAALDALGVRPEFVGATGAIERGAVLLGERMRVEVSAAALIETHRDRLVEIVAGSLFGEEGEGP